MYVDNRLIVLNSKDALQINGSLLSNCVFNCQGLLMDEPNILRTYISLINAQIPCSFYNITATNNMLAYAQLSTNLSFTIPIGNYSSSSLITQLIQGFGQSSVTSIILDKATGKLVFTFNTNTSFQVESTLTPTLGIIGVFNCFANISTPTTYPLNLLGVKRITIASDALNITAYNSKGDGNVLATIEVNQAPFNMLSYEQSTDLNKHILHTTLISLLDIQMFDENRNYINFNNIDWTMTICLSIERQSEAYVRSSLGDFLEKINEKPMEIDNIEQDNEQSRELTQNEQELKMLEG
jgi:hypothetical protein